ncbi:hypothetical protein C7M84_009746 [Penaeus vannamei]|uniref:Uncharacterized protein n=1 Tax=Penaeus vannamei TaxID=6689 RepID=A0A423T679_PENVA|nr:hypothetical protein C7M84_009746 [Penaeus vannamei]
MFLPSFSPCNPHVYHPFLPSFLTNRTCIIPSFTLSLLSAHASSLPSLLPYYPHMHHPFPHSLLAIRTCNVPPRPNPGINRDLLRIGSCYIPATTQNTIEEQPQNSTRPRSRPKKTDQRPLTREDERQHHNPDEVTRKSPRAVHANTRLRPTRVISGYPSLERRICLLKPPPSCDFAANEAENIPLGSHSWFIFHSNIAAVRGCKVSYGDNATAKGRPDLVQLPQCKQSHRRPPSDRADEPDRKPEGAPASFFLAFTLALSFHPFLPPPFLSAYLCSSPFLLFFLRFLLPPSFSPPHNATFLPQPFPSSLLPSLPFLRPSDLPISVLHPFYFSSSLLTQPLFLLNPSLPLFFHPFRPSSLLICLSLFLTLSTFFPPFFSHGHSSALPPHPSLPPPTATLLSSPHPSLLPPLFHLTPSFPPSFSPPSSPSTLPFFFSSSLGSSTLPFLE